MEEELGLYVKLYVKVRVKKEMSTQEIVDEFEQNCDYNISGTENLVVINTEYLETTLND